MSPRSLLRLLIGIALAILVGSAWTTSSEAHEAHRGPATTMSASYVQPNSIDRVLEQGGAIFSVLWHAQEEESSDSSCCGQACHAAMSSNLQFVQLASLALMVMPKHPDPRALSGPTIHIKRPPRSPAALVG